MTTKNIIRLESPTQHHMVGDGFRVSQFIPGYGREMNNETSPFLMLDYNAPWAIEPSDHRPGVGFHPHRGFETVTIVYSGEIEHQDTAGNGGVIGADEVQWMTAGSGLLHNEFMTSNFARMGGTQHVVQLWVNLPKSDKMTSPRYQALTKENIPEKSFDWGRFRVITGNVFDMKGAAQTFSPVELYDLRFDTAGDVTLPITEGFNAMILVTAGSAEITGTQLDHGQMAFFSLSGDTIQLHGEAGSKILVMAGQPLNEPIAQYGPFVMNTHEEIMQAFKDLRLGKMGVVENM